MRRHFCQRLAVIEIVVVGRIWRLAGLGVDDALGIQFFAQTRAHFGIVGEGFSENIASAGDRCFRVSELVGRLREAFGLFGESGGRSASCPGFGQRRQPARCGDTGARLALWSVWTIEIVEGGEAFCCGDFFSERIGDLSLLCDQPRHIGAPLLELAQRRQAIGESAHRLIVQRAGLVLAVAGDERHRRAVVKQSHGVFHMLCVHLKFICQLFVDRQDLSPLCRFCDMDCSPYDTPTPPLCASAKKPPQVRQLCEIQARMLRRTRMSAITATMPSESGIARKTPGSPRNIGSTKSSVIESTRLRSTETVIAARSRMIDWR